MFSFFHTINLDITAGSLSDSELIMKIDKEYLKAQKTLSIQD